MDQSLLTIEILSAYLPYNVETDSYLCYLEINTVSKILNENLRLKLHPSCKIYDIPEIMDNFNEFGLTFFKSNINCARSSIE